MSKKLEESRKEYRTLLKTKGWSAATKYFHSTLNGIFFEEATEEMINRYNATPLFNKPGYIIGKSQEQMDAEFNEICG